ncbi:MAG: hypothetical protein AMXMBFR33_59600 [Candidatus Xenobia bacterium]
MNYLAGTGASENWENLDRKYQNLRNYHLVNLQYISDIGYLQEGPLSGADPEQLSACLILLRHELQNGSRKETTTVTLVFRAVIEVHLKLGNWPCIDGSTILKFGDITYWAAAPDWSLECYFRDSVTWLSARGAGWISGDKIAFDKIKWV